MIGFLFLMVSDIFPSYNGFSRHFRNTGIKFIRVYERAYFIKALFHLFYYWKINTILLGIIQYNKN